MSTTLYFHLTPRQTFWLRVSQVLGLSGNLVVALLMTRLAQEYEWWSGTARDLLYGWALLSAIIGCLGFSILLADIAVKRGLVLLVLAMLAFSVPMLMATALVIFDAVFITVVFVPLWVLLALGPPAAISWVTRRNEWSNRLVSTLVFQELVTGLYLLAASVAYWTLVIRLDFSY